MVRVIMRLPVLEPGLFMRTEVELLLETEGFLITVLWAAVDFFLQLHMIDQYFYLQYK